MKATRNRVAELISIEFIPGRTAFPKISIMAERWSGSHGRASLDDRSGTSQPANASNLDLAAADGQSNQDPIGGKQTDEASTKIYHEVLQSEVR